MTRTERTYYVVVALWNLPGWFMHPVYPIFLQSRGLDLFQVGLVLAIFQFGTFLFEVPTGAVADLYGRKVSFLLSCLVRMLAFSMYSVAEGFTACAVAEIVDAFGVTLASGAIDAWAVDGVRAEGDHRPADRMFSRAQAIVRGVMVVGGVACGYLADRFGFTATWLVAASFNGFAFVVGLLAMRDDRGVRRASRLAAPRSMWTTVTGGVVAVRDHAVLRMLCLLTVVSAAAFMPVILYWPPRLEEISGRGFWLLGWAWAILNLAAVVGSLVVGPLLRRAPRVAAVRRRAVACGVPRRGGPGRRALAAGHSTRDLRGRHRRATADRDRLAERARRRGPARYRALGRRHGIHARRLARAAGDRCGGARLGIPAAWLVCAALFAAMAPLYLLLGRVAAREDARTDERRSARAAQA